MSPKNRSVQVRSEVIEGGIQQGVIHGNVFLLCLKYKCVNQQTVGVSHLKNPHIMFIVDSGHGSESDDIFIYF